MASISFVGSLGRDSEIKALSNGMMLKFTVATNTGWKDKKVTTWLNCALFGKQAESLEQYLKKGTKVFITGEFEAREYEKKDGGKGISLDVRVDRVELLGKREDNQQSGDNSGCAPAADDDQVPF
ncbi:MAG: Single-stranded DNA binding protein [Candidatus Moranbacteria bacterium GW2011_GWE2_47_10]|nr:MAG: Single-stranded DNA binding protein [Candidatus Moranbacteria bacterium GW2011_GWE2_47_10]